MESRFLRKRILLKTSAGDWYDGRILSVFEELGNFWYRFETLDHGIWNMPAADVDVIQVRRKGKVLEFANAHKETQKRKLKLISSK